MNRDFEDKVALITGATGGMGRATAVELARRGAKVVIAARREREGEETVDLIRQAGSDGVFVKTDVTQEGDARAMVEKAVKTFGRLDVAFNNAGSGINKPIEEMPLGDWHQDVSVNMTGVFLGMKAQIPAIRASGGGAIVNMSSQTATYASPGYGAYAAAKAGVEALSRVAAIECARHGIRVNTVAPGVINTDILKTVPPQLLDVLKSRIPMGRPGEIGEIAGAVAFLLSPAASFITGQNLLVEGGYTIGLSF